jgi:hypothetical protein
MANKKPKSSMLTKNGKTRLGPLNEKQLVEMLDRSSKPKERAKIRREILRKYPAHSFEVVEEVQTTEVQ